MSDPIRLDDLRPGEMGHEYTVATFAEPRKRGFGAKVTAYTRWYSPEWPGCVMYRVTARSIGAARLAAIADRRQLEDGRARREQQAGPR